jgi:hypothetical protein
MLKAEADQQRNRRTARKPSSGGDLRSHCSVQASDLDYNKVGRSPLGPSATSALVAAAGERSCKRQLVLEASEEVDGVREWDRPDPRYLGEGVRTGAG